MKSLANSLHQVCIITDIQDKILSSNILFQNKLPDHLKNNKESFFYDIICDHEKEKYLHLKNLFLEHPDKSEPFDLHFNWEKKNESHFRWKMTALVDENKIVKNICLTGSNITPANFFLQLDNTSDINLVPLIKSTPFENDMLFRDIAKNVPCVIYQWFENNDGSCGFSYISSKLKEYFNIDPADMVSFEDMIHPDDKIIWNKNATKEIKNLKPQHHESRFVHPDGSIKWWQAISSFPEKTDIGIVYNGILTDITELVNARQELIKSNERFNYAAKATSVGIWDWDCVTKKVYRSSNFLNIFGYKDSIIDFEKVSGRIHPEDRQNVLYSLQNAVDNSHDHWEAEYRLRCEDGLYKIVLNKATLLHDENKNTVRVIGAIRDMSAQRMLEKKHIDEEKQKKKEIIQAILAAHEKERKELSYELHDNINQVLATCTLLLDLAKKNPSHSKPYLEKCSNNIQQIINEIRDISRNLTTFTLDNLGLVPAIKDISAKINEAGKVFVSFKSSKTYDEKIIPPQIKLTVFRIIQEEINNVIKHANASELKIMLAFNTKKIKLKLADDGKGFEIKKIKKGLGLQNIQNRIDYFHGKMNIETAPGKGCAISMEFPY